MAEKSFSGKIIVNGTAINIGNGSSGSSSTASGIEPYIIYMSHADFGEYTGYQNTDADSVKMSSKNSSDTTSNDNTITNDYSNFAYISNYNNASDDDKAMIKEIIAAFFTGRPIYLYLNTPYRTSTYDYSGYDSYEYIALNSYIGSTTGVQSTSTNKTIDITLTFMHHANVFQYVRTSTGDSASNDFNRTYCMRFLNVPNDIADLNGFVENDTLIGKWATTTE